MARVSWCVSLSECRRRQVDRRNKTDWPRATGSPGGSLGDAKQGPGSDVIWGMRRGSPWLVSRPLWPLDIASRASENFYDVSLRHLVFIIFLRISREPYQECYTCGLPLSMLAELGIGLVSELEK